MTLALAPAHAEFPSSRREGLIVPRQRRDVADAAPRDRGDGRVLHGYRASIHRGVYPLAVEATERLRGRPREGRRVHRLDRLETVFTKQRDRGAEPRRATPGAARTCGAGDLVVSRRWSTTPTSCRGRCSQRWARAGVRPDRPTRACSTSTRSTRCSRARPKLVAVAHVSNVLGTINPIEEIVARAHAAGAIVLVDGAQAVPSMPVDVAALGADFYAWTGHKAYGPTGIGVLHGRRDLLEAMPPFLGGGHMIARVGDFESTWAEPPAQVRGGHDADRRGDRARRRRRLARAASAWTRCASTAATSPRYALERLAEVDGPDDPRPADRRCRGAARLVRARRHPPARRGRDPRPPGRLRARRAPLRAAADAPPRRAGVDARAASPSTPRARTSTAWSRASDRCRRCSPRWTISIARSILEHYKRPQHWGELEDPDLEFFDVNPLCGDELKVQIKVDDDNKVADVALLRPRLRDLAGRRRR